MTRDLRASVLMASFAVGFVVAPGARAGSLSGVVQELTGAVLPGIRITVTDLTTGSLVGTPVTSGSGGVFSVPLPNGAAISVNFDDPTGVHLPAAMIGISGNTTLSGFTVFMPLNRGQSGGGPLVRQPDYRHGFVPYVVAPVRRRARCCLFH